MRSKALLWTLTLAWTLGSVAATAQSSAPPLSPPLLSPPIAGGIPAGTGAGVHSPNSPFAPLQERSDVLAWSVLTAVKTRTERNRILPVFPADVRGFMMPLQPGERQRHFLLSSVPLTCSFCVPGGPESMVEVRTKTPVRYVMEPVVVEGKFAVLADDPYGMYYRMTDAIAVK